MSHKGLFWGPLLFLTYINDLPARVKSNMKLYADDATVYINYTDANIAHDVISKDLKYIESWADQWLVKFSATKTKAMNVSFKQEQVGIPPFVFNNTTLEKVLKNTSI